MEAKTRVERATICMGTFAFMLSPPRGRAFFVHASDSSDRNCGGLLKDAGIFPKPPLQEGASTVPMRPERDDQEKGLFSQKNSQPSAPRGTKKALTKATLCKRRIQTEKGCEKD